MNIEHANNKIAIQVKRAINALAMELYRPPWKWGFLYKENVTVVTVKEKGNWWKRISRQQEQRWKIYKRSGGEEAKENQKTERKRVNAEIESYFDWNCKNIFSIKQMSRKGSINFNVNALFLCQYLVLLINVSKWINFILLAIYRWHWTPLEMVSNQ